MATTHGTSRQPGRVTDPAELLTMSIRVNHDSDKAQKKLTPFFLNILAEQAVEGEGRKLAHSVKSRVKPPEDIMSKIKRKRRRAKKGTPILTGVANQALIRWRRVPFRGFRSMSA